jgi:hypothetical protein
MSDLYFIGSDPLPSQEGAERGVRLEIRLVKPGELQDSIGGVALAEGAKLDRDWRPGSNGEGQFGERRRELAVWLDVGGDEPASGREIPFLCDEYVDDLAELSIAR